MRNTIKTILKTCNLSTEYLDTIAPVKKESSELKFMRRPVSKSYTHDYNFHESIIVERKVKTAQELLTLR